ncbi:hypothetical protein DRO32_01495 [Candidatus Bathyarchaeota archaeon]|nr:MAG: hypothetical protein DRO32_01495 [Candidatus Bathyarchaeota archaeon]
MKGWGPMPPRKLKVELYDWEGTRYVFSMEGRLTKEKIACILELVERLGAVSEEELILRPVPEAEPTTIYEKIQLVIDKYFPGSWFTTRQVKEAFEREFREPVRLSTVSTYLARMADRGLLVRAGPPSARKYRLNPESASFPQGLF